MKEFIRITQMFLRTVLNLDRSKKRLMVKESEREGEQEEKEEWEGEGGGEEKGGLVGWLYSMYKYSSVCIDILGNIGNRKKDYTHRHR